MGASQWGYFVPYQADMEQALQDLRQQVFRDGTFYNWRQAVVGYWKDRTQEQWEQEREQQRAGLEAVGADPVPLPTSREAYLHQLQQEQSTIESLLVDEGTGTHSILDIRHVGTTPDAGTIIPLPSEVMLAWWETTKPTHEMVAAHRDEVCIEYGRWSGAAVIVYQDDHPTEMFFGGYSGD
jgi:hypothetical protein